MLAHDELAKLLGTLRIAGVRRYREGGVEVEFFSDAGEPGSVAAHNRDSSGATPEPATAQERHVDELELLLRSSGSAAPERLKRYAARDGDEADS